MMLMVLHESRNAVTARRMFTMFALTMEFFGPEGVRKLHQSRPRIAHRIACPEVCTVEGL